MSGKTPCINVINLCQTYSKFIQLNWGHLIIRSMEIFFFSRRFSDEMAHMRKAKGILLIMTFQKESVIPLNTCFTFIMPSCWHVILIGSLHSYSIQFLTRCPEIIINCILWLFLHWLYRRILGAIISLFFFFVL